MFLEFGLVIRNNPLMSIMMPFVSIQLPAFVTVVQFYGNICQSMFLTLNGIYFMCNGVVIGCSQHHCITKFIASEQLLWS